MRGDPELLMWHRVAALLGGHTVDEWRARMSSAEFTDWCAFYLIEPWGFVPANWRAAMQAAVVANHSGMRKRPAKISDFLPAPRGAGVPISEGQLAARLAADVERARGDNGEPGRNL